MSRPVTNATRLTRIETILERLEPKVDTIENKLDEAKRELQRELRDDKADLAALKNRGIGVLVGLGLLAGAIGAKLQAIIHALVAAFR